MQGDAVQKAEALIWAGDFNYRIDGPYEDIRDRAVRNDCASLLPLVRRGGKGGRVGSG